MRSSPLRHVLAVLRLKIGYRQKEMAALVHCSRATIQAVELNQLKLSESLASRISLATGVDFSWLMENQLGVPIQLSADADRLVRRMRDHEFGQPEYTKEVFEFLRKHQAEPDPGTIWYGVVHGLEVFARLRAIVESARSQRRIEMVDYKIAKFLEELQAEFGFDEQVVDLRDVTEEYDPEAFEKAWKFVVSECVNAQMFNKFMNDERDPDTIPETERKVIETMRQHFKTTSPYAGNKVPTFADRLAKARALDFADIDRWMQEEALYQASKRLAKRDNPNQSDFS